MAFIKNIIIIYYIVINVVLLLMIGIDKYKAKNDKYRIPENALFMAGAIGGFFGGIVGMFLFHHKTHKPKFYMVYIASLLVHVILFYYLLFIVF